MKMYYCLSDRRDSRPKKSGSQEAGGWHPQPGSEGDQGTAGDWGQPACEYQGPSGQRSDINFTLTLPLFLQVVKLKDVFPHGTGFVLVFDFMLSDLSEVIRNSHRPLTPAQVKGYMIMLLKGVAFLHHNNIMHRVRTHTQPSPLQSLHQMDPDPEMCVCCFVIIIDL